MAKFYCHSLCIGKIHDQKSAYLYFIGVYVLSPVSNHNHLPHSWRYSISESSLLRALIPFTEASLSKSNARNFLFLIPSYWFQCMNSVRTLKLSSWHLLLTNKKNLHFLVHIIFSMLSWWISKPFLNCKENQFWKYQWILGCSWKCSVFFLISDITKC